MEQCAHQPNGIIASVENYYNRSKCTCLGLILISDRFPAVAMTKSKIQEFYLTAKKLNEIRSESFFVFWSLFVSADKIVTLS